MEKDGVRIFLPGKTACLAALVLAFNLSFLINNLKIGYNVYDDGIAAFGASRVLHGEMPYRDFWTSYAPGNFYLEAALFRTFGENLLVQRIYGCAVVFLIPIAIWFAVKKVINNTFSLIAVSLGALSFGFWGPAFGLAFSAAGLLMILSVNFALKSRLTGQKGHFAAAGILTGFTALFKHDFGLILFISIIAYLWLSIPRDRSSLSDIPVYLLGTMCVLLPVGLYFAVKTPMNSLFEQFVRFPLEIFPDFRRLPFPKFEFSLNAFPFYYPVAISVLALVGLVREWAKKGFSNLSFTDHASALFLVLASLLFVQSMVRADAPHLFSPVMISIILSAVIIAGTVEKKDALSRLIFFSACGADLLAGAAFLKYAGTGFFYPFFLSPVFVVLVIAIIYLNNEANTANKTEHNVWPGLAVIGILLLCALNVRTNVWYPSFGDIEGFCPSVFPRANGILVPEGAEKNAFLTSEYIKDHVPRDKKIFVGAMNHDKLSVNNILIYFFTGRGCASRYHELHPGVVTTEKVQSEIVRELEKGNVEYVVLEAMPPLNEPNASSVSSGVHMLDDFISRNYIPVVRSGPYIVLKEKQRAL